MHLLNTRICRYTYVKLTVKYYITVSKTGERCPIPWPWICSAENWGDVVMRIGPQQPRHLLNGSCFTLKMDYTMFSLVYFLQNLDTNYSFLYLLILIIVKELEKIVARTLCFMHQNIFRPNYIFNNDAYFLDLRAQKFL